MLKNFLKNRKAQNTAEYALLIALVVAGIIAMQTYAQRAIQARIHDVSTYMANATSKTADGNSIGDTVQYEPQYLVSDYNMTSNSEENKRLGQGLVGQDSDTNSTRTGYQTTTFNIADESSTT